MTRGAALALIVGALAAAALVLAVVLSASICLTRV